MAHSDYDFAALDEVLEAADDHGLILEEKFDADGNQFAVLSRIVPGQNNEVSFEPLVRLLTARERKSLAAQR